MLHGIGECPLSRVLLQQPQVERDGLAVVTLVVATEDIDDDRVLADDGLLRGELLRVQILSSCDSLVRP